MAKKKSETKQIIIQGIIFIMLLFGVSLLLEGCTGKSGGGQKGNVEDMTLEEQVLDKRGDKILIDIQSVHLFDKLIGIVSESSSNDM